MKRYLLPLACALASFGCQTAPDGGEAQSSQNEPPELVDTSTRPTNKQWKGTWALNDRTIFFSNDFEGGRLNGIVMDSANHFTLLITAENYPINPSPWYAFKAWSTDPVEIQIELTYTDSRSRYYPKVSDDGINFQPLDSSLVTGFDGAGWGIGSVSETIEFSLSLTSEPVWVAAQELWTSSRVNDWMNTLAASEEIDRSTIGDSREGRPIWMMKIGNEQTKKGVMIISRQHPPEVTGFLAMKSFIETIADDSDLARAFRSSFAVYNVPLMNPDGVDNGHWRHNTGGIDLNRDWQEFNQPETSAVRDFLHEKTAAGVEFVFGSDFHSTWRDIYYPLDSSVVNEEDLLVFDWINRISTNLGVSDPNVQPSKFIQPTMVSRNFFYQEHGIPSIVFEIGDNTDRGFVEKKGKVAAEELMKILLDRTN